jgi:alpha-beta hydrolase superfamily lysophospholipase
MNPANKRKKVRSVFRLILLIILIQILLINISGFLYGYKLTYFYEASGKAQYIHPKNIFAKTWNIFVGPRLRKSVVSEVPHFSYETVHLFTKDSLNIEGWYVPVDSSKGTVILIHGLGGNKSTLLKEAYEFMYLHFNVMLIDLRAHGNSSGNVTMLGFSESEDVKLAYDYIYNKGERNIILYGFSLGATTITKAIYDYGLSPSHIILELPFESQEKLFAKRGKFLGFPEEPFGAIVTFWASMERGFNAFKQYTSKYVQKITCPVLLQYAALDQIVPPEETIFLFDHIASHEKKIVRYEKASHEYLLNNDPRKWRKEVYDFLFNDNSFADGNSGTNR